MYEQPKHEMIFAGTLPSGAEEWSCPICGRRTLIHWEPEFKRTVLEAGDNLAIHSAVKADPPIASLPADATGSPAQANRTQPTHEDPRLAPWIDWLNQVDFENLWNDGDQ
jgi:hypothetical protein